jgi:hypothetical protein
VSNANASKTAEAQALPDLDYTRLSKILGRFGSDQDGEILSAVSLGTRAPSWLMKPTPS